MEICIKQMILDDLDQVMSIEPIAFGSHHWSRQSFVNELNNPNGFYFTAKQKDTNFICGYSGFWLIAEEAHITTLAVHPDLRRNYIGERLLVNNITSAREAGASWMTLEVRISNESAQQLYYKYGFRSLGLRRKYYQDNNEDALVLWAENISSSEFKKIFHLRMDSVRAKLESKILSSHLPNPL